MLDQPVPHGLVVAYRASDQSQEIFIDATGTGPGDGMIAPVSMATITDAVVHGAAGGSSFAPSAGRWNVLAGPDFATMSDEDALHSLALGDTMHWRVEVAAVCPLFIRTVVEHLGSAFGTNLLKTLSIRGSVPLDDTALSVRERDVLSWLDDRQAYPGAWPHVPFSMTTTTLMRGASLKVELSADVDDNVFDAFELLIVVISSAVADFSAQTENVAGVMDASAHVARGRTDLRARWDAFHHTNAPVARTVTNMLIRFHEQVAPIARAELGMA